MTRTFGTSCKCIVSFLLICTLLTLSSCDVREPLPDVEDVEQIYHLASPASPDHFAVSPIEILETNFLGTKNVLNLAVIRKARVLLASTSGESLRRATVKSR
jgi:nucleoside-diphosphate-sugar epimerase